jgi:DNA-directed RNA polymerase specialized sigma24 family protein
MELKEAPDQPLRRPRQAQRRLTVDQQAELIDRYLDGERAYLLAQAFDVHRTTVARLLADNGVRRPRSLTKHEIAESIKLYRRGWSCQRIGEKFGRDDGTIWLALKKAGVKLRQPWTRPRRVGSR